MSDNKDDPMIMLLLVAVFVCGLAWLIWYATGNFWLDNFFRWLRFGEIWILNLFKGGELDGCLVWLRVAHIDGVSQASVQAAHACFGTEILSSLYPEEADKYYRLTGTSIVQLGAYFARYYRWLPVAALVIIIVYTLFTSPYNKFKTKHTLESLIAAQAKMWPVISPMLKINPSKSGRLLGGKVPEKLPLFAEALSPEEWIAWNRVPIENGVPDKAAARRAFIKQLGSRFKSVTAMPLHIQALLAAFALRGVQRREESDELLGRLAQAWDPKTGFALGSELKAEIRKILSDPKNTEELELIMQKHAWRTTAVLAALKWARDNGGVLAPAAFLWLRAEDRNLWYPLNNLGRRAFHSEGAGAMAHFMAEELAERALVVPRVDNAVATLNAYLKDPEKRRVKIPMVG
ncbi:MAG: hypothetical protein FWF23_00020 [Alphaproteobacteria bacterium]|nr:hypothetical protein [Alphaproteobacteria bacterium]MCL2505277.1 hypothetical protein [Alphaproteobacteria bacterium]